MAGSEGEGALLIPPELLATIFANPALVAMDAEHVGVGGGPARAAAGMLGQGKVQGLLHGRGGIGSTALQAPYLLCPRASLPTAPWCLQAQSSWESLMAPPFMAPAQPMRPKGKGPSAFATRGAFFLP